MNVKYIHSLGGQAKDDAEKTLSLANLTEVGPRVIRCRWYVDINANMW